MHDRLADLAPEVLAEALRALATGTATRTPQNATLATYAPKLEREHGRIDWALDAPALERRIRAYDPWPGTFAIVREADQPKRLKVCPPIEVCDSGLGPGEFSTADGSLRLIPYGKLGLGATADLTRNPKLISEIGC